jgi:8-oxo-dGTP pyrophosphatase MutT (NUDIX family)
MSNRSAVYFSVRGLVKQNNKILLIHERGGKEHWETPGGSLKPKEPVIQTLHREMIEELGTDVKVLNKMPFFFHTQYKGNSVLLCYFFVKPLGKLKITKKGSEEVLAHKYFSKKELLALKKSKKLMIFDAECLNQLSKILNI